MWLRRSVRQLRCRRDTAAPGPGLPWCLVSRSKHAPATSPVSGGRPTARAGGWCRPAGADGRNGFRGDGPSPGQGTSCSHDVSGSQRTMSLTTLRSPRLANGPQTARGRQNLPAGEGQVKQDRRLTRPAARHPVSPSAHPKVILTHPLLTPSARLRRSWGSAIGQPGPVIVGLTESRPRSIRGSARLARAGFRVAVLGC